jgi:pyruvate formate lyase activating enzyme
LLEPCSVSEVTHVTGTVFSIERYAIHDGPGIRTQVFFKGCPLRCLWCSNPEGMSFTPQLTHTRTLCIRCGACVDACENQALSMTERGPEQERDRCILCGNCADACYAEALEINSVQVTPEEILNEVERDRVFYEVSGDGGITLCGGEPLAQAAFAVELLKLCKQRGIHTAIETCGCYPFEALERAIPYLDFIYYDLKHMSPTAHKEYTGAGNDLILENLKKLQAYEVDLCVRVPVIPTLNDSVENMEALASFVKELPRVKSVQLLPYHRLGVNKYQKLGLEYPIDHISPPDQAAMQELQAVFHNHGILCSVK